MVPQAVLALVLMALDGRGFDRPLHALNLAICLRLVRLG